MYNRKKKKSLNFLTKQFYIDNQGDAFCCVLMAIMGMQMISITKSFGQPFVRLNHERNLTNSTLPLFERAYNFGPLDSFTVFTCLFFWLTLISVLEEYITDRFIPRLRLSLTTSYECRIAVFSLFFSTYLISHQFYSFLTMKKFLNLKLIFAPENILSFHTKISIILSLTYFMAMIIKLYVSKTPAKNGAVYVREWLSHFSILILLCQLRFNEFAIFGLVLRSLNILWDSLIVIGSCIPISAGFKRFSFKLRFLNSFIGFLTFGALTAAFVKMNFGVLYPKFSIPYCLCLVLVSLCDLYYIYDTFRLFMEIPKTSAQPMPKLKDAKTSTPIQSQNVKQTKKKQKTK